MNSPAFATRNGSSWNSSYIAIPADARAVEQYSSPANITSSAASANLLYAASYSADWFGLYTATNPGVKFKIELNTRMLSQLATENGWNLGFIITNTLVHEYGHALSLADNPPVGRNSSIMRYDRPRNEWKSPRVYDVDNVNQLY